MPEQETGLQLATVPEGIELPEWERLCALGAGLLQGVTESLGARGTAPSTIAWEGAATVGEEDPAARQAGLLSRASVVSAFSGTVALVASGALAGALLEQREGSTLLDALWEAAGLCLTRDLGTQLAFAAAPPIDGAAEAVNQGLGQIFPEGESLLALRARVTAPAELEGALEIRLTTALARQLAGPHGERAAGGATQAPEATEAEASPGAAAAAATADAIGRAMLGEPGTHGGGGLGPMDEIELEVAARLGEVEMKIEEVLRLGPGTVIELDRRVEDPVDVLVHGQVIARAEVVVVGEKFALKIQQMVGPR